MKKIFSILCAASALLISCAKVAPEAQEAEAGKDAGKIKVNIAVNRSDDTKAVKTGWEKGDVIYVFFNNLSVSDTPKYLTLTFDGNGWDNTWYGDADADLLTMSTGTMTAVYFPFHSGQVTIAKDGDNYTFKNGTENIYSYYMKCEHAEYSVSAGVLTGTLAMAIPGASTGDVVQLYIPDENPVAGKYSLTVRSSNGIDENYRSKGATKINNFGVIVEGTDGYDTGYGSIQAYDKIKATVKTTGEGKGYYFYAYKPFESYAPVKFRYYLYNEADKKSYVLFTDQTSLTGAVQLSALSDRWIEFVELDFICVAAKNINASTPEESGSYFAWGETLPKSNYVWDNYQWTTDGGASFTKYNTTDGKTVLDPEDDAATVLWGAPWRTPTHEEIAAIVIDPGNTLAEENGCLKITNPSGYSVLIPAGGQIQDTWNGPISTGTEELRVILRTSSLYTDVQGAYSLAAKPDGSVVKTNGGSRRSYGVPIRPVFDKRLN